MNYTTQKVGKIRVLAIAITANQAAEERTTCHTTQFHTTQCHKAQCHVRFQRETHSMFTKMRWKMMKTKKISASCIPRNCFVVFFSVSRQSTLLWIFRQLISQMFYIQLYFAKRQQT